MALSLYLFENEAVPERNIPTLCSMICQGHQCVRLLSRPAGLMTGWGLKGPLLNPILVLQHFVCSRQIGSLAAVQLLSLQLNPRKMALGPTFVKSRRIFVFVIST